MDGSTIVAIVAAIIALGTAAVALWQAIIAKGQANTAQDQAASAWRAANASEAQAREARRNAVAAEKQVKAAQDQLDLQRQQAAAEQAERDKRDAPVLDARPEGYSGQRSKITARVERTPGPIEIRMTSLRVRRSQAVGGELIGLPNDTTVHNAVHGSDITFDVDLRAEEARVDVLVTLEVTEVEGAQRQWSQPKSVTFPLHPQAFFAPS